MNPDIVELTRRVDALERALAEASRRAGARARLPRAASLLYGGASTAVAAAALIAALSSATAASGPTTVTAPFTVVDSQGRALLSVAPGVTGGGTLQVFSTQSPHNVVQIGVSSSGCCGSIAVYRGDDEAERPKVAIGVDTNDKGMLRLEGAGGMYLQASGAGIGLSNAQLAADGKALATLSADPEDGGFMRFRNGAGGDPNVFISAGSTGGHVEVVSTPMKTAADLSAENGALLRIWSNGGSGDYGTKALLGLTPSNAGVMDLYGATGQKALAAIGDGQIFGRNAAGTEVMSLGVDGNDQGYFIAKNHDGKPTATLSVGSDGTGMAQVFKSNELSVIMGTKDGNKGDVCANGPKSMVCLSVLAARTFMPY